MTLSQIYNCINAGIYMYIYICMFVSSVVSLGSSRFAVAGVISLQLQHCRRVLYLKSCSSINAWSTLWWPVSPRRAANWSGRWRRWYSAILCGFSLLQQPCGLPWCSRSKSICKNRVGIWLTDCFSRSQYQFPCHFSYLPRAMFFEECSGRYLFGYYDDEPIPTLA